MVSLVTDDMLGVISLATFSVHMISKHIKCKLERERGVMFTRYEVLAYRAFTVRVQLSSYVCSRVCVVNILLFLKSWKWIVPFIGTASYCCITCSLKDRECSAVVYVMHWWNNKMIFLLILESGVCWHFETVVFMQYMNCCNCKG